MAAKYRICITGYPVQNYYGDQKLDLMAGIFNLVDSLQKSFDKQTNIILVHGAGTALELWAGDAARYMGIPLEIFLPFNRITHIARSGMKPIQVENLNEQIAYADLVKVTSSSYYFHGYMKRTKAMIDHCNLTAIWEIHHYKTKNFQDYCIKRKKGIKDLIFYSLFPVDENTWLQGDLLL